MASPAILVGNRTGGQGKTLISQLIHYGYKMSGVPLRAVSADSADNTEASKLGSLIADVEELGTGATMAQVRSNQHLAVQYWDRLGELLLEGGCVIDLGANILPMVFQWAAERQAGRLLEGKPIFLVVPVTAQRQSIDDAAAVFNHAVRHTGSLAFSRKVLVLNEYHGTFDSVANDMEFKKLVKRDDGDITVVTLSRANVEVWEQIEAKGFSIDRLMKMNVADYAGAFGVNAFAASGAEAALKRWVHDCLVMLHSAGLVPEPAVNDLAGANQSTAAG